MKNVSRRKFLATSAVVAATPAAVLPAAAMAPSKELFVHHVYFFLKNKGNEADRNKLMEGLEKLKKVPTIRLSHVGVPAATNRSVIEKGYDVSWMLFFDNLDEEEMYQKHPIHLKFVEDYSHLWEKVIVYDAIGPAPKKA